MIVKKLEDLKAAGVEKVVAGGQARTLRYLTRKDRAGFTVSDVHLEPGADSTLWYKNHIEANLVLEGEGTVEDLATGQVHRLAPGVMYIVYQADRHRLRTRTAMRLVSVFNPALVGDETHDQDGSYPAPPPD